MEERIHWQFRYDEDDFIVAENPRLSETVQEAMGQYLDDIPDPPTLKWLISEWSVVQKSYPGEPHGVGFNATVARLGPGGLVTVLSRYDHFTEAQLPETEFLQAISDFEIFLNQ